LRQRDQRIGLQHLDKLHRRHFGARRQLDDQRLPRGLDKAGQRAPDRVHCRCNCVGRAGVPDALGDRFSCILAADVLGAGILSDPEIDAAGIAHRELDRAGFDLRRRSDRLGRVGREYRLGHVGERNPRRCLHEAADFERHRLQHECAGGFRPDRAEIDIDRRPVQPARNQHFLSGIVRIERGRHFHRQPSLARDRTDELAPVQAKIIDVDRLARVLERRREALEFDALDERNQRQRLVG
jgi:hypothetical protein